MSLCFAHRIRGLLTQEECEKVMKLGVELSRATVGGGQVSHHRTCFGGWVEPTPETEWLFDKVMRSGLIANEFHYKFDIDGMESMNLLQYEAGQQFKDHFDNSTTATEKRKITISIQLTDGLDYAGGDLAVYGTPIQNYLTRERGDAMIFPSYLLHSASPVTAGTRHALVGWLSGPRLK